MNLQREQASSNKAIDDKIFIYNIWNDRMNTITQTLFELEPTNKFNKN